MSGRGGWRVGGQAEQGRVALSASVGDCWGNRGKRPGYTELWWIAGVWRWTRHSHPGIVFGGSALIGTIIRNVGCILFEDCPTIPLIVDCPNTSAERPTSGTLCVPGPTCWT